MGDASGENAEAFESLGVLNLGFMGELRPGNNRPEDDMDVDVGVLNIPILHTHPV